MSRTIYTHLAYRDTEILARVVKAMGGQVLGLGTHQLYASRETGFGIKLPRWQYPLVVKPTGQFAYDDYHGQWGNIEDLKELEGRYTLAAAAAAAEVQGWQMELTNEKLVIYHPSGGTLIVTPDGKIDADCFVGINCADATEAIAKFMGPITDIHTHPAYFAEYVKEVVHE